MYSGGWRKTTRGENARPHCWVITIALFGKAGGAVSTLFGYVFVKDYGDWRRAYYLSAFYHERKIFVLRTHEDDKKNLGETMMIASYLTILFFPSVLRKYRFPTSSPTIALRNVVTTRLLTEPNRVATMKTFWMTTIIMLCASYSRVAYKTSSSLLNWKNTSQITWFRHDINLPLNITAIVSDSFESLNDYLV